MLKRLFDRLRNRPAQPDVVTKMPDVSKPAEPVEPSWRAQSLETMSDPDRATMRMLRHSFEQRGPGQHWYYAGAGTDVVPILIAPADTTHHFVDPIYGNPGNRANFEDRISQSFLRESVGVHHQSTDTGSVTTLEGDGSIAWDGRSAADVNTVPNHIDTIYTNLISYHPHPKALQQLKVGGLLVIKGRADAVRGEIMEHPVAATRLTDMGFRLLHDDIMVEHMNPSDSTSMLTYSHYGSASFNVYEKTREFTEHDKLNLWLNDKLPKMYETLRAFLYSFNAQGTEQASNYASPQKIINSFKKELANFKHYAEYELDDDNRLYAIEMLRSRLGQYISHDVTTLFTHMLVIDRDTHEQEFSRYLQSQDLSRFIEEFTPIWAGANAALQELLPQAA